MTPQPGAQDHFRHSSLREGLLEQLFTGAVMRELWRRGRRDFELLRPQTDHAGYDVVMAVGSVIRHIQLKSSGSGARTSRQGVNIALARKPSGCVIWIRFDEQDLALGPFGWFGGPPGAPLPDLGDRIGRHAKGDATGHKGIRPAIRVLNRGDFLWVEGIAALTDLLFGPASASVPPVGSNPEAQT